MAARRTTGGKAHTKQEKSTAAKQGGSGGFARSVAPMEFHSAQVVRFLRNLDKHKVLTEFIRQAKLDHNNTVTLSPATMNLGKSLLAHANAHENDVFARSLVGNVAEHSDDPTKCPHKPS